MIAPAILTSMSITASEGVYSLQMLLNEGLSLSRSRQETVEKALGISVKGSSSLSEICIKADKNQLEK